MKTNNELYTIIGQKYAELAELYAQLGTADEAVSSTPAKTTAKKAPKAVEEAPVVEDADEEEDGEEVEFTKEGLNELSLAELKELADDNEIEYTKSVKKQPLIKIILDAMEDAEDEEDADADAEEESADVVEDAEEAEVEDEEERDTVIETEDGEIDLATMTFGKLKALAKEYEIEITAKNKDGAIDQILAGLEEDEEEDEADVEEEDGEEEIDLDAMDLDELKSLAEEEGIELPKKKKNQKPAAYTQSIRDIIEEALTAEEADEDEEEEEEDGDVDIAEEYGLNDMDAEELAEILESYEMSTKGKKQALIARIVKGVEDGEIEFEEEEGE